MIRHYQLNRLNDELNNFKSLDLKLGDGKIEILYFTLEQTI